MTATMSSGILLYRVTATGVLEVWIAHMGGPFWASKDAGAWSIPKGELDGDESELDAALREFREEIGTAAPEVPYIKLGDFKQSSSKVVVAFAGESDFAIERIESNTFQVEWPPRSGRLQEFPEMDAAAWFPVSVARTKLVKGQLAILEALENRLRAETRDFETV